jgi:hypothetical protein
MVHFIKLQTYDAALNYSRLERIIAYMTALAIVVFFDVVIFQTTTYLISTIAGFASQIGVLLCWRDMALKRKPDKNCWEFKE